jgi:hypothetical protein
MTSPLDTVYDKYKHLDFCLSDPEWCRGGSAAIYAIAGELWRAVKEARGQPSEQPTLIDAICDRAYLVDGKILCDGRMRCEHQGTKMNEMGLPFPYVLCEKLDDVISRSSAIPSKKRRDAWIWTTCKGCKFKKQCDILQTCLPPCGRDYDEELSLEHDALIAARERAAENKRVLTSLMEHFLSFKDQKRLAYSAADMAEYVENFMKLESLRAQPEPKERNPE